MTGLPPRVYPKKQQQKIGYLIGRRPVFNDTAPIISFSTISNFEEIRARFRLAFSFSGGYYTPCNTSSFGDRAFFYRSKLAGNSPLDDTTKLRKFLLYSGWPGNMVDSTKINIPSYYYRYAGDGILEYSGMDDSGNLFDEVLAGKFGSDASIKPRLFGYKNFLCGLDSSGVTGYFPPGIPILYPKLTNFYQEFPVCMDQLSSGGSPINLYTDSAIDYKEANVLCYSGQFIQNYSSQLIPYSWALLSPYKSYKDPNPFVFNGFGKIAGTYLSKTLNYSDAGSMSCSISDSSINIGVSKPAYYWDSTPMYSTPTVNISYSNRGTLALYGPYWPSNKLPFSTNTGLCSAFIAASTNSWAGPFTGAISFKTSILQDYQNNRSLVFSDHIDFLQKSLFLYDTTTGNLEFNVIKDDLILYTFAVNSHIKNPSTPSSSQISGTGPNVDETLTLPPASHTVTDAKKLVRDWFLPIHNDIPTLSTMVSGDAIPAGNFLSNCNRQRFNVRLDTLNISKSDIPDGKISIIITNPGIFIDLNDSASGPSFIFNNSFLFSGEKEDNLFIDLYFFPYCQYGSTDFAPGYLSSLHGTDIGKQYLRNIKTYYQSFDKVGQFLKQTKPLDTNYIAGPNFGLSPAPINTWGTIDYTESEWYLAADGNITRQQFSEFSNESPKGDFLDYYDSSFEIFIVAGHIEPEDIPDYNDINTSGMTVLYSSKSPKPGEINSTFNSFKSDVNSKIKEISYSTIFSMFSETPPPIYSSELFDSKDISLDAGGPLGNKFNYFNSPGFLKNQINPFFNLIVAKMDPSLSATLDAKLKAATVDDIYLLNSVKSERFPFQKSYFPVPIGPTIEPLSFSDEIDYIKEFGSFYEFKCFFTGFGIYDPGSLDSFYIGVFASNLSKKIKCYVECLDFPACSGIVEPEELGKFLSEVDVVTNNTFTTSYVNDATMYKYAKTWSGKYWDYPISSGTKVQTDFPRYSTETDTLINYRPLFEPADDAFQNIGGDHRPRYPKAFIPGTSLQKLLTKKIDIRFFVLTFRVYVAPVPGHVIDPLPTSPFLPGYLDSGSLKADGLLDFKLEFCSPLFDHVDEDYKYLSVENSPDKTQYDSVFRIYSHMLYPLYL